MSSGAGALNDKLVLDFMRENPTLILTAHEIEDALGHRVDPTQRFQLKTAAYRLAQNGRLLRLKGRICAVTGKRTQYTYQYNPSPFAAVPKKPSAAKRIQELEAEIVRLKIRLDLPCIHCGKRRPA